MHWDRGRWHFGRQERREGRDALWRDWPWLSAVEVQKIPPHGVACLVGIYDDVPAVCHKSSRPVLQVLESTEGHIARCAGTDR